MENRINDTVATILAEIEAAAPPAVLRTHPKFKEWTGVGGRRMANLDVVDQGPDERVMLGRQVAYPRKSLLRWIARRLAAVPPRQARG